MKSQYSYVIIKENNPYMAQEHALLSNKYKKTKRYAMITKTVHKDGSENITTIDYSSNMEELQSRASGFISWYNYPLGLAKDIQGHIRSI